MEQVELHKPDGLLGKPLLPLPSKMQFMHVTSVHWGAKPLLLRLPHLTAWESKLGLVHATWLVGMTESGCTTSLVFARRLSTLPAQGCPFGPGSMCMSYRSGRACVVLIATYPISYNKHVMA